MAVIGVGTGGSINGIGRMLKKRVPGIKIIGVRPIESIVSNKDGEIKHSQKYHVEGIGYRFLPPVLDMDIVDDWENTGDSETFLMARRLLREEGWSF